MAINLADVGSGYKRTAINNNFQSIEDEINNNLLSKNGGIGLEADLDANSQKIINLDDGVANSDAVNLGQVNGIINAAGSGLIVSQKEVLLGSDAVSRVFTFTGITYVPSGNNLAVYRNGQRLETIIDYLESGTAQVTLTFDPNANDRFVFITNESTDTATTAPQTVNVLYERQVATAGQTAFTLTNSYVVGTNGITVYVNGILQTIAEYVETSNSVITFNTSLTAGDNVDFYVGQALISTPISTTGITHNDSGTDYTLSTFLQNRNVVNVKDFGAVGDGVTDDTAAFNSARDHGISLGGVNIFVPAGEYVLNNFDIESNNIVFIGASSGGAYGDVDLATKLIPHTSATYVVRLKNNSAEQSGFKDIQFKGTSEYGLFIDSGNTILDNVVIQGFQYGCVIADGANNNLFNNCTFVSNTKAGFSVSNHNNWVNHHPNVTPPTNPNYPISQTSWFMNNCLFRLNEFGCVIRTGMLAKFNDCTFESNVQAGLYIHRDDNSVVRNLVFDNCWFENNYDISQAYAYTISGNNAFALGSGQVSWANPDDTLYEIVVDSQTSGGGGCNQIIFKNCTSSSPEATKKGWRIKSGIHVRLEKCYVSGGNVTNYIQIESGAIGTKIIDLVQNNDPTEVLYPAINAIVDNSTSTTLSRTGHSDRLVSDVQIGLIRSNILLDGSTTSTDANALDYYEEGTFTPTVGGTWTVNPSSIIGRYTRVGDKVTIVVNFSNGTKSTPIAGWLEGLPYDVSSERGTGTVVDSAVFPKGSCLIANTNRIWLTDSSFGIGNVLVATYFI